MITSRLVLDPYLELVAFAVLTGHPIVLGVIYSNLYIVQYVRAHIVYI